MKKILAIFLSLLLALPAWSQTSTNIGLPLQGTNTNPGTWGNNLNMGLNIIDAIHGPKCYPALKAGADFGTQVNACYLDTRTTATSAGIIDATVGYAVGAIEAVNSQPFTGAVKSGVLRLGALEIAMSVTILTPRQPFAIIGIGTTYDSSNAGNATFAFNTWFTPCLSNGSPTGCTAALSQTSNLLFQDDNPSGNCPGTPADCRQHGPFSALGSGLTGPGNYYAMIGLGGQSNDSTCGSGPVGSDWSQSAFGAQLINVGVDVHGLPGVIGIYSGNIQERSKLEMFSVFNYGGTASGLDGVGVMMDRNAHNGNSVCSGGNAGPSHIIVKDFFLDSSGPTASQGYGFVMEGQNPTLSNNIGLAQYAFTNATIRGSSAAKQRYGIWIDNYVDGSIIGMHFENTANDAIYLQGTAANDATNWIIMNVDQSAVVGNLVHLATGTNNNTVINVNGGPGSIPGVRDDVFGCPGAFNAAPPCLLSGTSGYNPSNMYIQGGFPMPNFIQFAAVAPGPNAAPLISGGTGAPSGGTCGTTAWPIGSMWLRSDGTSGTVSSMYSCKMVSGTGTWVGN